ncbi:hypothetical protein Tco_0487868 [Tanacetum coccineum]
MFGECSYSCVDGILVDGESWSMEANIGESAKTTALGAAATGTEETTIVGGLNLDLELAFISETNSRKHNSCHASNIELLHLMHISSEFVFNLECCTFALLKDFDPDRFSRLAYFCRSGDTGIG